MSIKTPTDWWNRHLDSPLYEEMLNENIDLRRLMCAMFERAWNDLEVGHHVSPHSRRSAIMWFRGSQEEKVMFNFNACSESIGMTSKRIRMLEDRITMAEQAMYGGN
jgi:hypothetical protein